MSNYISIVEAFNRFSDIADAIKAKYGADDITALREGWNDFTDSLCKDGEISSLQYDNCPAYDDVNVSDDETDEMESLLDSMSFGFHVGPCQSKRGDGLMPDMPRHFHCTISRGSKSYEFWYSQGEAHKEKPEFLESFSSLLQDAHGYQDDFSEWCAEYGYDDDSRKAYAIWEACNETRVHLLNMMTAEEMEIIADHFNDLGL